MTQNGFEPTKGIIVNKLNLTKNKPINKKTKITCMMYDVWIWTILWTTSSVGINLRFKREKEEEEKPTIYWCMCSDRLFWFSYPRK